MKLLIILLLCIVLQTDAAFALSSGTGISSVNRLDLSDGLVTGERAEYSLKLPKMWSTGYIIADSEYPTSNSDFLEKIIFSYVPQNKSSKPVAFMNFYVFKSHMSIDPARPRKIVETNLYTFAVETTTYNGFSDKSDLALFDYFLLNANNDAWIKNLVVVPKTQRIITSDTVTVNGKLLKSPAMQNSSGVVYIPVREACGALGYNVQWLEKERAVRISKGDEAHLLSLSSTLAKQNYPMILVSDKAYITSIFFMRSLNANIEVDSYNNVTISTTPE